MVRLAVIGFGGRASGMVRGMCRDFGEVRLVAVADPDEPRVRERMKHLDLPAEGVRFYDSAEAMLEHADDFDGLVIGTRCYLHTPMAVLAAKTGKPLFLEKPVAISHEQLDELADAWTGREKQVVVSFPLRVTPACRIVAELLDERRIGTVNHVQAFNDVSYGAVYYNNWYRRFDQVGGLWLQKATHDFDYLNELVGARPTHLAAMMTQKVFGRGSCPDGEGAARVMDAAELEHIRRHAGGSTLDSDDNGSEFDAKIKNQDAGSAMIWYEDGTLVSYNQNFIARKSAGRRGARLIGYKGTIDFSWSPVEEVRVVDHHSERVDTIKCPATGGHGGGDYILQKSFIDIIRDQAESVADLSAGLLSVSMCLAARESCQTRQFKQIRTFRDYAPVDRPVRFDAVEA